MPNLFEAGKSIIRFMGGLTASFIEATPTIIPAALAALAAAAAAIAIARLISSIFENLFKSIGERRGHGGPEQEMEIERAIGGPDRSKSRSHDEQGPEQRGGRAAESRTVRGQQERLGTMPEAGVPRPRAAAPAGRDMAPER